MPKKIISIFIFTIFFSCSKSDNNSAIDDDNNMGDDDGVITTLKAFKKVEFFYQGQLDERYERYYDEQNRIKAFVEEEMNFSYDSIVFSYPNTNGIKVSQLVVHSVNEFSDNYITTYNYEYGAGAVDIMIELFNTTTNMAETSEFKYELSFNGDYINTFNKTNVISNEVWWSQTFEYDSSSNCTKSTFTNSQGGVSIIEPTQWDSGKIRDPLQVFPNGIEDSYLLLGANLKTSTDNAIEYIVGGQSFTVDYEYDSFGNIIEFLGSTYEYIEL